MEESAKKNVVDLEEKVQSALIYDYFTYGSLPCKLFSSFIIVTCRTVLLKIEFLT